MSPWLQSNEAVFVMDKTSLEMVEQALRRVLRPGGHFGSFCHTRY